MVDILNIKDTIVKVLFGLNIVALTIGVFVSSKAFYISVITINLIFTGTFIVISAQSHMFQSNDGRLGNLLGKVGNTLDSLNNKGDKNG